MNCIECFNRSRNGLQVCSPFFFVPGAPQCCQVWSIAAVPFAPFLVSRCCQVWSVTRAPFAPFLVPRCCQVWSVARCTFCARPGAFLVPTLLRYTYYSISQILELFAADPTPGSSL